MATFRDLQDRIALDHLNRFDLMDSVRRAIVNTIKTYEGARFWFNEAQTSMACSAGQSYISVPSDFLYLDRVEISYSGGWNSLHETSFETVREMNANSATSVPTHYHYREDRFELALLPDSAYPALVYYVKSLPPLSADTDSNAWTNEAQNLIAHAATIEILTSVLAVPALDKRRVDYHMARLQMAQKELNLRNTTRFHGRLRATSF